MILTLSLLALAACSDDDGKVNIERDKEGVLDAVETEEATNTEEAEVSPDVEFIFPAHLLDGVNTDEMIAKAKDDGIDRVSKNDDGSITYKMTTAQHEEILAELKTDLVELLDDLVNDGDYEAIKDVNHKPDFSEFTFKVDKEKFALGGQENIIPRVAYGGLLYRIYEGNNVDELQVKVVKIDDNTGETFGTITYPEGTDETD